MAQQANQPRAGHAGNTRPAYAMADLRRIPAESTAMTWVTKHRIKANRAAKESCRFVDAKATQRARPGFYALLLLLVLVIPACAQRSALPSGDPQATVVAHDANGVLVIDRMRGGQPLELRPTRSWRDWSVMYVPREDGAEDWTLSLTGSGQVTVMRGNDAISYASVTPSWDNNAIRLTLERRDGTPLRTDVLTRVDGASPASFGRLAQSSVDLRGTYDGAVRDRAGEEVGWLHLKLGRNDAPVVFEGALPPDLDEAMNAALLLALASEVDWVENHVPDVSGPPDA